MTRKLVIEVDSNGPNRVLMPQGKAVKRIVIEVDSNGQLNVNSANPSMLDGLGNPLPLQASDVIVMLMQTALALMVPIVEASR